MKMCLFARVAVCGCLVGPVLGGQVWDESIDGDLSNDALLPTHIGFDVGMNIVSGTVGGLRNGPDAGDFEDVFVVDLLPGQQIESLLLLEYTTGGGNEFTTINFIESLAWDGDFSGPDYRGVTYMNEIFVGGWISLIDLLPIEFRPLLGTTYVLTLRDTTPGNVYSLGLIVTPGPGSLASVVVGCVLLTKRRRLLGAAGNS